LYIVLDGELCCSSRLLEWDYFCKGDISSLKTWILQYISTVERTKKYQNIRTKNMPISF